MTTADPQTEEREARTLLRRAEKARRVRQSKVDSERWAKVREYRGTNCRCELRPGMSYYELVELGAGCTGSDAVGRPGWVCPVLDFYRQLVRGSA